MSDDPPDAGAAVADTLASVAQAAKPAASVPLNSFANGNFTINSFVVFGR
jgi:hypothetical protein